ncbi:glycosyltransferase [Kiloniella laminariae]|uniref:Glycosyltransferase n=1 Tax=Kiloniella laminariae TaxID=454162 RepID=A0ABT4LMJ1_9PROT|nr:glycosyltransferase [Kiloniella laminariae]MCZ4282326.1 glycosyltransferase [Kiloniella laminariae]
MKTDFLKIAYVIPTKDRPNDLQVLLNSFEKQSVPPEQIVICDGSSPSIEGLCKKHPKLPITYVRCFPPSLSKQRNAGMAAVKPNITIAGYLDDDIELAPDANERMLSFWQTTSKDTGGASLGVVNQPIPVRKKLYSFFGIDGSDPGKVLTSGFATSIPYPAQTIETQWLYGGATLWKREIFEKIQYDEWYIGHGYLEDLDYSYRVSRSHRLYVVADSKCWHYPSEIPDSKRFVFGRQQIFNRLYFTRKMATFSKPAIAWAIFGLFLIAFLGFLRHMDAPRKNHLFGMLSGLLSVFRKRQEGFDGSWKE